jgi:hypothetical protein
MKLPPGPPFGAVAYKELLDKACAAFDALSPEEKRAHRREQAISFAYGNLALSGSAITKEMVAQAYDEFVASGAKPHE